MNNFQAYSKYYEALYKDKDYEKEAAYVTRLVRSFNANASEMLELGCGTGKHAEIFCRNGFSVTGLERSADMVSIAKEKSIKNFTPLVADISNYKLEQKFDVAISLFHVVSYLTTNQMVLSCFNSTSNHLEKGGLFLFDVWYSPAVYHQQPETRVKRLLSDHISITRLAEPLVHYNENVVDVSYEVIVKDNVTGMTDVFTELHPMRHFSWPEIELLAMLSGYKLVHAEEFGTGSYPGKDTWGVCFILQKN
jgi:SAM-dependent methyltransferase